MVEPMSDCNETIRELDAFLDGELADDVKTAIHQHLDGCIDCLQAFDFHAELKAVIQQKCRNDEMPPGLMAKIEQCLQADLDDDGMIGG
jgi:anti-sigma factor (TIGR02949 family)